MYGPILGPNGEPIRQHVHSETSLLIETAVEIRVNTAVDALREHLRDQHRRDSITSWVRYGALIVLNALVAAVTYIIGPEILRDWTREFVAVNMNKPMLEEAANAIISSRLENHINAQFEGVEQRLSSVSSSLEVLSDEQDFLSTSRRAQLMDLERSSGSRVSRHLRLPSRAMQPQSSGASNEA